MHASPILCSVTTCGASLSYYLRFPPCHPVPCAWQTTCWRLELGCWGALCLEAWPPLGETQVRASTITIAVAVYRSFRRYLMLLPLLSIALAFALAFAVCSYCRCYEGSCSQFLPPAKEL